MHKIVALYPAPTDPAHFKSYYEGTHLPLARQLPGLKASRHTFDVEALTPGGSPYFCIWEGDWADRAAADAALGSEMGGKVAADTANYASGGITLIRYDAAEG